MKHISSDSSILLSNFYPHQHSEIIYWYWRNCIPYWPNCIPNRTPILEKDTCFISFISSVPVYDFTNTSLRFQQYWYTVSSTPEYNFRIPIYDFIRDTISPMPVCDFVNACIQFCLYRYMIWTILVYDFVNTGIWFCQYWWRYIFKVLGRFEVEIEDCKNMGALEICLDQEKNKQRCKISTQVSLLIGESLVESSLNLPVDNIVVALSNSCILLPKCWNYNGWHVDMASWSSSLSTTFILRSAPPSQPSLRS